MIYLSINKILPEVRVLYVDSLISTNVTKGYQRLNQNVTQGKPDSHEGLDLYAPVATPDPRRPLWGTNQWPSQAHVPGFQETYEKWVEKMKRLGLIVMEACAFFPYQCKVP